MAGSSSSSPVDAEKSLTGSHDHEGHVDRIEGDDDDISHLPSKAEASAQLIGVAVLEFGVILHRYVHCPVQG